MHESVLVRSTLVASSLAVLAARGFDVPQTLPSFQSDNCSGLTLADLDNNGTLDVVVSLPLAAQVGVILNAGVGVFGTATEYTIGAMGANPRAVVAADMNASGILDLVSVNAGTQDVSVLTGPGLGTFGAFAHDPAGLSGTRLAVGYVKGTINPDVVVASSGANSAAYLSGEWNGLAGPVGLASGERAVTSGSPTGTGIRTPTGCCSRPRRDLRQRPCAPGRATVKGDFRASARFQPDRAPNRWRSGI